MDLLSSYGFFDRLVHRVAFATKLPQTAVADLEDRLYRKSLEGLDLGPPVLVTGLPRAGTTILLEMLAAMQPFAAHTYRDMPFVLCPMIWSRLSRRFQKPGKARERAHGDGIEISPDSPEAFEEIVWMQFWRRNYGPDAIVPWERCDDGEFVEFFASHMRKIVALRRASKPAARRYLSKNNANLARIPAIWGAVPSAIVVVPFREPLQHAASLLKQHRNFGELHEKDAFARRYMAAIGHFDFGANLKPIDFDGWLGRAGTRDPAQLQFWLEYWVATYRHVLRHAGHERLVLTCDEALTPDADVGPLAGALELADPAELASRLSILKATRPHRVDTAEVGAGTLKEAAELYEALRARAVLR
jgi:hypothetical protein